LDFKQEKEIFMKQALLIVALTFFFIALVPSSTDAGSTPTVTILAVDVKNDGMFIVDVSQPTTGAPACASVTNRLSANSDTAGGKALLQLAISVYLSGRTVSIDGTGACREFSNIESIARIYAH
jgi:hypothetical protein